MSYFLKKTILLLVAIGFLLGFQASSFSDSYLEKSEIFDISCDEDNLKEEASGSENYQLLSQNEDGFEFLKISLLLESKNQNKLQTNFLTVLTSPPNC
ncbi:MAG: hypothetical protein EBS06_02095 [Proteobacteria bacterium]|nr:hypothetical protein [Pseudomonadota bacterium]